MIGYTETPIQQVKADFIEKSGVRLFVKREDLNHPMVSGNKWWKLKYNLEEAKGLGHRKLVTFGGAYSNHIYATAAAAQVCGLESTGVIRGEEVIPLNTTLSFAKSQGMQLYYVSREVYRKKAKAEGAEKWKGFFGECYLIPEGGTNGLALKGCAEWGKELSEEMDFDYLCLPTGTGGTLAGLVAGLGGKAELIGFSVLKNGFFLKEEVGKLLKDYCEREFSNWSISTGYDQGGYAKTNKVLQDFILSFQQDHKIPLEPVYTGKMMFGICDLVQRGFFKRGSTILALHTGGLRPPDKSIPDYSPQPGK